MPFPPRLLLGFERFLATLAYLCTLVSGLCLVVLVATFGWLVFGRYVLNATPTWVEQLALLLVVVITFLSSAVGVKERTHLNVAILPFMLSPANRSRLYILLSLVLGGFGLTMMVQSYHLAQFNWTTNIPLLDLPEGLRSVPMIASGGLITLFSFGNLLKECLALRHRRFDSPDNPVATESPAKPTWKEM